VDSLCPTFSPSNIRNPTFAFKVSNDLQSTSFRSPKLRQSQGYPRPLHTRVYFRSLRPGCLHAFWVSTIYNDSYINGSVLNGSTAR
jgi:hypothetical protein